MNDSEYKDAIYLVIEHEDLQQYLHPNAEGRVPVVIKPNNYIHSSFGHKKYDKEIIISETPETEAFFEIINISIKKGIITFSISYEIEGLLINGLASKKENSWKIEDLEIIEN